MTTDEVVSAEDLSLKIIKATQEGKSSIVINDPKLLKYLRSLNYEVKGNKLIW